MDFAAAETISLSIIAFCPLNVSRYVFRSIHGFICLHNSNNPLREL